MILLFIYRSSFQFRTEKKTPVNFNVTFLTYIPLLTIGTWNVWKMKEKRIPSEKNEKFSVLCSFLIYFEWKLVQLRRISMSNNNWYQQSPAHRITYCKSNPWIINTILCRHWLNTLHCVLCLPICSKLISFFATINKNKKWINWYRTHIENGFSWWNIKKKNKTKMNRWPLDCGLPLVDYGITWYNSE